MSKRGGMLAGEGHQPCRFILNHTARCGKMGFPIEEFILFAVANETYAIQTPATKRLIPTRVRYKNGVRTG
jgi:hypothetical protein